MSSTTQNQIKELWSVDCNCLFQNYDNFRSFPRDNQDLSSIGGFVFGRRDRRQVIHVFFSYAEDITEANVQFIQSSLSSDIEHVGNVQIDGHSVIVGEGFTLNCTFQMLENHDVDTFLDLNSMFNNEHIMMEGLSLVTRAGFEWSLRSGREAEDCQLSCDRLCGASFRFVYINTDKNIIIREHKENEIIENQLDEWSKNAVPYKSPIELNTLQSLTRDTSKDQEDQKLVPTVKINKDGKHFLRLMVICDVVSPAFYSDNSMVIYNRMREAFKRRIYNVMNVTVNGIRKGRGVLPTKSAVFLPNGWVSLLHLQLPTKWTDNEQRAYRIRLHKLFNLRSDKPCLKLSQSLALFSDSVASTNQKLLRMPHLHIQNYKPLGTVATVKGPYNYHHYMQDGINDSGWGCAYRSFQTIWSWFILNGYTDKPVPSHREIQQCLVDIGDKESKFVGSHQWIGSTEISFVLNTLLNLECRFIATNSGAEVVERARELLRHFDTCGTPVMIGGNMLAHTILGVDFNENTGETKFLVLDPHYTGSEDIKTIISKGWCNWKPESFWSRDHFYNMVLPQVPTDII